MARIPSIIPSTFLGDAISSNHYLVAGIIMGIMIIISVLGIVFNKQIYHCILSWQSKRKLKKEESSHE